MQHSVLCSTLFSCGVKKTVKVADSPGATLLPASGGPTTWKYSDSCSSGMTRRETLTETSKNHTGFTKLYKNTATDTEPGTHTSDHVFIIAKWCPVQIPVIIHLFTHTQMYSKYFSSAIAKDV